MVTHKKEKKDEENKSNLTSKVKVTKGKGERNNQGINRFFLNKFQFNKKDNWENYSDLDLKNLRKMLDKLTNNFS